MDPIIGASIAETDENGNVRTNARGSVSDLDGHFSFFAEKYPGTKVKVSYIGYKNVILDGTQDMIIQMK